MRGIHQIIALLFLSLGTTSTTAQTGTVQNLYFKKGSNKDLGDAFARPDYMPGKKNFYIYRNCIYFFKFRDKQSYWLKVTDIRNDSIYYTRYYNLLTPWRNRDLVKPDTFRVHPSFIKAIGREEIGKEGIFRMHSLRSSRFIFTRSDHAKGFEHHFDTVTYTHLKSSYWVKYERIPHLTKKGVGKLQETVFSTYVPPVETPPKTYRDRNVIWFTPSNANTIRGVNIGLLTMSWKENKPINIYGVNLNADVLSAFLGVFAIAYLSDNSFANMADTVEYDYVGSMKGLSISAGGLISSSRVHGLSINGMTFFANEMKGLLITGTQSFSSKFVGVMISGLRNKSVKGRGLQIGLLNVCRDLKGVQVGLWNINGKRKLPFINWGG
jgi:hypothetical protein